MSRGYKKIGPDDGKPFVKGDKRINRQGRPPKLPELDVLLAETLSDKDAMRLILLALIKKAKAGDVRAAELLMDRGWGKLTTKQDTNLNMNFKEWTEETRISIINELLNTEK